mmetsp:Transcript_15531/g.21042  ORF Transcript_15531/g.21042 Transcript_15531/m.21042 type:complete len:87 (-) Transcript_15531:52-312(-)
MLYSVTLTPDCPSDLTTVVGISDFSTVASATIFSVDYVVFSDDYVSGASAGIFFCSGTCSTRGAATFGSCGMLTSLFSTLGVGSLF